MCLYLQIYIIQYILIHYHCTTGLMLLYRWNVISSLMLYGWSHKPYKDKPLCLNFFFFNFFFEREFQLMASTLEMRPNVVFQIELLKTNSGLAKSTLQRKTRGYAQKQPPTGFI